MTVTEKLNILEDLLDIDRNSLSEDMEINEISEWDSIAVISTIAMFDNVWNKKITADDVKNFKTVKDILDKMEWGD